MLFTKRRLEPSPLRALLLLSSAAGILASASCSSTREEGAEATLPDASSEASDRLDADGGTTDSAPDVPPFDGGLLPVTCEGPSCALELVSTDSEGFCALLGDGTVACWGANGLGPTSSR